MLCRAFICDFQGQLWWLYLHKVDNFKSRCSKHSLSQWPRYSPKISDLNIIPCSKSGKERIWTSSYCTLSESWICTQVNYKQQRQWELPGQRCQSRNPKTQSGLLLRTRMSHFRISSCHPHPFLWQQQVWLSWTVLSALHHSSVLPLPPFLLSCGRKNPDLFSRQQNSFLLMLLRSLKLNLV